MPVHFMGGVFVAMLTIYILYKRIGVSMASKQNLKVLLIILAGTFVFGFLWEIFEFFVQGGLNGNLANVTDSVSDMCFDLAGGIFASIMYIQNDEVVANPNNTNV